MKANGRFKPMPWCRLYNDIRHNAKLSLLAFEDQRHFIWILTIKNEGLIDKYEGEVLDRIIAKQLGLDISATTEAKRRLQEVGLIQKNWTPVGWDECQYQSDLSTERSRKSREKKKTQRPCNGDATLQQRPSNGHATALQRSRNDEETF